MNYHIGRLVPSSWCVGAFVAAGIWCSNTQRTENKTTDVVIHQHSRKLLKMDILMSETCWRHNKWNKIASDIKLVFHSSTIEVDNYPIETSLKYTLQVLNKSYLLHDNPFLGNNINSQLDATIIILLKFQSAQHVSIVWDRLSQYIGWYIIYNNPKLYTTQYTVKDGLIQYFHYVHSWMEHTSKIQHVSGDNFAQPQEH